MPGLFGLIYTTCMLAIKAGVSIKENYENEKYRQKAIKDKEQVYVDSKGNVCFAKDGKKVMYSNEYLYGYNNPPNKVLKYVDSEEIIRNFSQEDKDETETYYFNEAKKLNRTAYRIGGKYDNYCNVGSSEPKGYRYKDINTGNIYVIREFNGIRFYMDIKNGFLIRKTDGQLEREKKHKKTKENIHPLLKDFVVNIIEKTNKDALEYQKKYNKIDYQNNRCFLDGRDWHEEAEY